MDATEQHDISVQALKAGDRAEFARLMDVYSTPIYRLALRMLRDPQDAEDVLQQTFFNAFKHLGTFEGRSSLPTWLYRIAANEALMLLRRRHPEVSFDDPGRGDESDFSPREFVDWAGLPEDQLLSQEARRYLELAIENLPGPLRWVFTLRDMQGLSIKETAQALELTEANVKTRLLRARLNLREQLSAYYRDRLTTPKEGRYGK